MNRILLCVALLLSVLVSSTLKAQSIHATQQDSNKAIIITVNRLFNEGKNQEATAYFSDSLAKKGNINGKSFFVAMQEDILQTFPDVKTSILDIWADGDWVICRCNFSGTHSGIATLPHHGAILVGLAPTNKSFSVQHIRMYKIKNGKITARQAVRDDLGMLKQLGLLEDKK